MSSEYTGDEKNNLYHEKTNSQAYSKYHAVAVPHLLPLLCSFAKK